VLPTDVNREALFRLVRAGFGQRRKMLRRSLEGLVHATNFDTAAVPATHRAEQLSLQDWIRLTRAVEAS
jgi:16S rRNA (adenine1518-N6/adenine1519-N6)-dimethyltransferase